MRVPSSVADACSCREVHDGAVVVGGDEAMARSRRVVQAGRTGICLVRVLQTLRRADVVVAMKGDRNRSVCGSDTAEDISEGEEKEQV